jgi:hypothetical protein
MGGHNVVIAVTSGDGFERTGTLNKFPSLLRSSVENLAADHRIDGSKVSQCLSEMIKGYPAMGEEYSHPGFRHDQMFQVDLSSPRLFYIPRES